MIAADLTNLQDAGYRLQRVEVDSLPDTLLWMLDADSGAWLDVPNDAIETLLDTAERLTLVRLFFHDAYLARGGVPC